MRRSERERANVALAREMSALLRRLDPPPAQLRDAARDLLSWRTIDVALAELLREGAHEPRGGTR